MSVSPGARLGPYEVVGLVGAGGMGVVYRGRDTRLQRPVAIKVITADLTDPSVVRRFEAEALSASALNHPNILTVYEFGDYEGMHYLVTEFIEGETLRERLRGGPLRIALALDIVGQLASALEAAHAAGLVHRDVKPENVMLRPDGYVKVLDFGLAKLAPTTKAAADNATISLRTTPGTIVGTIGYMAPEQVRAQAVDQRADVWSTGVVLHEMLCGSSPFSGTTMSDVIASVLEREPPPLSSCGITVPAELQRIVSKALQKDRVARYQTIKDFLLDVRRLKQQIEAGAPLDLSQVPGSHRESAARGRRRRSWPAFAGMLAVALVMAGSAGWKHWRAERPRSSAAAVDPRPVRTARYWLTVQKYRDGKPYQSEFASSGMEIFEDGWKFRLNFLSPDAGFLYLLNLGPAGNGRHTLQWVYPTPLTAGASAAVAAGQQMQTGWNGFDPHQGTEQFWIVWSAAPIAELERAKRWLNADHAGTVNDAEEAAAIQRRLEKYAADVKSSRDSTAEQMILEGRGDVLVSRAELKHH